MTRDPCHVAPRLPRAAAHLLPRRPGLAASCAAAAFGGAVATLGWAPFAAWPLALIAFALLYALVHRAAKAWHAGLIGLAFGLGMQLAGHAWIFTALHGKAGLGAGAAALSTLLVFVYLAGFIAVPCWLARAISIGIESRHSAAEHWSSAAARALSFAGLLTLGEWARSFFFNGFTSLSLGYSVLDTWLGGSIAVGGLYLASWFALLACALLANFSDPLFTARAAATRRRAACLLGLALRVLAGWALQQIESVEPHGAPLSYRLIQSNVSQARKFDRSSVRQQARQLAEAIEQAPADLIATPETALPVFLGELPADTLPRLQQFSQRSGSHVYLGIARAAANSDGYNSVLQLSPHAGSGIAGYDKARLMPFGEYSPVGFGWFTRRLAIPLKDLSAGDTAQPPFALGARGSVQMIGTLICHEDLIGRDARSRAASSHLLLNPSNLAWFDGDLALAQRLQIARLRAREIGRPILRVANTGITAEIGPAGQIVRALPAGTDAVLSGTVQPMQGQTLYARLGDALPVSLCLLGLLANLWPGARRGRSRR